MTRYIVDHTAYQGALTPADYQRAEFAAVSFKISHGLGQRAVHPQVAAHVAQARTLGLGLGSSHFLTGDATGAAQATYAFGRMQALGLVTGTMHQVDVEDNAVGAEATLAVVREYVTAMTKMLQRPVVLYTGDWWWQARGWDISDLTPYLWAAPNAGYQAGYPGDTSAHWSAGWGGWPTLSVMQYAVAPLVYPDGTRGTMDVSKSAIRTEAVWSALTGGGGMLDWVTVPCLLGLRGEFNTLSPNRDKGADGTIGDSAHTSTSDHTPDEQSDVLRGKDADTTNEVHALDIDSTGPWPRSFDSIVKGIIARERARWLDPDDVCRLEYVIWNRQIYSRSRDFAPVAYTGDDPHTNHAHFSARYLTQAEQDTSPWGVEGEGDMAIAPDDLTAIAKAVWAFKLEDPYSTTDPKRALAAGTWVRYAEGQRNMLHAETRRQVLAAIAAEGAADKARDAALSAATATAQATIAEIKVALTSGSGNPDIAPILARLDSLGDEVTAAAVGASHDVLSRIAAAQDAEAAALRNSA